MAGFGFFRATLPFIEIAVEADIGKQVSLRIHPHRFVFIDGDGQVFHQPLSAQARFVLAVEIGHQRGVKRRLRAGEVVAAVGVEHFAVILNLVGDVFHHAFGQIVLVVRHQTERDEIAVPAVHFVETAAGYHIRQRFAALGVVFQSQQAGFFVDFGQQLGRKGRGGQFD